MASIFDTARNILGGQPPANATEAEVNQAFLDEARLRQEEAYYVQRPPTPLTAIEERTLILTPSQIEDRYHGRLVKELMLSHIPKSEVPIIRRYLSLIYQLAYDGQTEVADMTHAEMMGRLMTYRSVDGWQQEVFNKSSTQVTRTSVAQTAPATKAI